MSNGRISDQISVIIIIIIVYYARRQHMHHTVKNTKKTIDSEIVYINHTVCQKTGTLFCFFCHNFVNRDQILVIFASLVAKEICNRKLLSDLKAIAGTLR